MISDELRLLLADLKNEIVTLRTEVTLLAYDLEKMREQLDRIDNSITNPPPPPIDMSNWHVEKL